MTYNPSAVGGGLSGLTTNTLPVATSATTIADSWVSQGLFGIPANLREVIFTVAADGALTPGTNMVGRLGRNTRQWSEVWTALVTSGQGDVTIRPNFGAVIRLDDGAGTRRWNIAVNIEPETTNAVDLGSTTKTVRTGYFGTSVTAPLLVNSGNTIILRGVTYTLPSADGSSGQYLGTNGSGTLSWSAPTFTPGTSYTFPAITPPGTPASGWVVYTDTADGLLKAKNSAGTVKTLA